MKTDYEVFMSDTSICRVIRYSLYIKVKMEKQINATSHFG
jgi:hypothetical protein